MTDKNNPVAGECPSESQLAEFVEGKLADTPLHESIKKHIDICFSCRFVVNNAGRISDADEDAVDGEETSGEVPPAEPISLGMMVDHFEIVGFLGRGGMGEVFLARDTKLGREVALKCVHENILGSKGAIEKFVFEAQTTARFNHPNIVTIHSTGTWGNRPYLALEYLKGETLRQRFGNGPMQADELVRVAREVTSALKESHSRGFLHRDLKPENVFITEDGQIRVLDFGLARQVSSSTDTKAGWLSQSDQIAMAEGGTDIIAGTPLYLAPELPKGSPVSEASDVWALGLVLFEGIAGYHPLKAAEDLDELSKMLGREKPIPKILKVKETPPALATLIDACLSKDPALRPSASDLFETLDNYVDGLRQSSPIESGAVVEVARPSLIVKILWVVVAGFFSWALMYQARNIPSWILSSFSLSQDSPGWVPYAVVAVICIGLTAASVFIFQYIKSGKQNDILHGVGFIVFPAICLFFSLYHYLILVGRSNTHLAALYSYTAIGTKQAEEMTSMLADSYLQYLDANIVLPSGLSLLAIIILLGHVFIRRRRPAQPPTVAKVDSILRRLVLPAGIALFLLCRFVFFVDFLGSMGGWTFALFIAWVLTAVALLKTGESRAKEPNIAARVLFIGIVLTIAMACVASAIGYRMTLVEFLIAPSKDLTVGDRDYLFNEVVNPLLRESTICQGVLLVVLYALLIAACRKSLLKGSQKGKESQRWRASSLGAILFITIQMLIPFMVMGNADRIYAYYKFEKMVPAFIPAYDFEINNSKISSQYFYIDKKPQSPRVTANEARLYCEGLGKRLPTPSEWESSVGRVLESDEAVLQGLERWDLAEWTMVVNAGGIHEYYLQGTEGVQGAPDELAPGEHSPKVGFRCAFSF